MKRYVLGTHKKCLGEVLLMSTNTIYFCGKIRKLSIHLAERNALSGAMLCISSVSVNTIAMYQRVLPYSI